MKIFLIRILFTIGLLYLVGRHTHWSVALAFALFAIETEISQYLFRDHKKEMKEALKWKKDKEENNYNLRKL